MQRKHQLTTAARAATHFLISGHPRQLAEVHTIFCTADDSLSSQTNPFSVFTTFQRGRMMGNLSNFAET